MERVGLTYAATWSAQLAAQPAGHPTEGTGVFFLLPEGRGEDSHGAVACHAGSCLPGCPLVALDSICDATLPPGPP